MSSAQFPQTQEPQTQQTSTDSQPERIGWMKWISNGLSSIFFGSNSSQSFVRNFRTTFGNPRVPFLEVRSLIDAVDEASSHRKFLVLFVHSQSIPASADMCRQLQSDSILNAISQNAYIYGVYADTAEGAQIVQMLHAPRAPVIAVLAVGNGAPRALCVKTNLYTPESVHEFVRALSSRNASDSSNSTPLVSRTNPTDTLNRSTSNPVAVPSPSSDPAADARRELLEEQRREYEEAVRAERERLEAEERRQKEERETAELLRRSEEEAIAAAKKKENDGKQLAEEISTVMDEFATVNNLIRIVIRMTNGSRATLKLPFDTPASFIYKWVAALPYLPDNNKYHGGLASRVDQGKVEVRISMPPVLVENNDQSLAEQGVEDGCALMVIPSSI